MRRLPLALLPLLLLLLLLLLPLLLPLLLSLEGDKKRVNIYGRQMTERGHSQANFISTPRTGGSFSRKLPRRCVSPPSDATTAWAVAVFRVVAWLVGTRCVCRGFKFVVSTDPFSFFSNGQFIQRRSVHYREVDLTRERRSIHVRRYPRRRLLSVSQTILAGRRCLPLPRPDCACACRLPAVASSSGGRARRASGSC